MATDLFTWLDVLWQKSPTPDGTPPVFMIHRFLASERVYAAAARVLQQDLRREPDLLFHTWKGLLPQGRSAPRLQYVAAKKPPAAEALTERMVQVLAERREVVEEIQELYTAMGKMKSLYYTFGVEPPKEDAYQHQPKGRKQKPPVRGGLLGGL